MYRKKIVVMRFISARFAALLIVATSSALNAQAPQGSDAVQAAQLWWRAFAEGDTAHLQRFTAADPAVVLSAGRAFDRHSLLAEAATHIGGAPVRMEWFEDSARAIGPGIVLVTSRQRETIGRQSRTFRFSTLLRRAGSGWQVAFAQTTREVSLSPRANVAGPIESFAGVYRTPAGGSMRVVPRDSMLVLVDPSGVETILEAVGPDMFETARLTLMGVIRFGFARGSDGRVNAMLRIADDVITFPRVTQ
jgi:hypothetical protein